MRDLIEVYGDRTGNCLRVTIALEEAAIGYSAFRVDLARGEQREALHLRRNPFGQVPTIVDRRVEPALVLSQSNAILFIPGRGFSDPLAARQPCGESAGLRAVLLLRDGRNRSQPWGLSTASTGEGWRFGKSALNALTGSAHGCGALPL